MGKTKHQVLRPESPIPARIDELKRVIPEVFADGKVDWDRLREVLGEELDVGPEHYGLSWPGKREARRIAFQPSRLALRPEPKESVNFDKSENLIIEGENLEVLKLLRKSYAGRIKMIYIDPPYNTGNDFVYKDDFSETVEAYEQKAGMRDEEGAALMTNRRTGGRFHSNWLSMIYPRLMLARNLLTDDGVIFISIDDHEVDGLRAICSEVFGEENFISQLIWNTEGHTDNQFDVKVNHEYILLYARTFEKTVLGQVIDPNTRAESNLWKGFAENSITKNGPVNPPSKVDLPAGFPCHNSLVNLPATEVPKEFFITVEKQGYITRKLTDQYEIVYPIRLANMRAQHGKLTSTCSVYSGWANVNKLRAFIANKCQPIDEEGDQLSFYLSEKGVIYYRRQRENARNILSVLKNLGTTERMRSELEKDGIPFQYPKPKELLSYLVRIGGVEHDTIMDFFAGSGTIAQAVLELNKEDGGNRKFILVQMPEATPVDSEARKAGYETIADICKERVRRAIKKMKPEAKGKDFDLGFKLYKLGPTSFAQWTGFSGDNLKDYEKELALFSSAVKEDAKEENLLSEVILREGFPLTSKVATLEYDGISIHRVESDACEHRLLVCLERKLDKRLSMTTFKKTGIGGEDVFVCLDEALNDEGKNRISELCSLKVI